MIMTSQFADMTVSSNFFDVVLFKFNYWSKFHLNIMTGSGVVTIFFYKGLTRNREIGNTPVWLLPRNVLAGMFLMKCQNARVTGLTVSVKRRPTHTPRLVLSYTQPNLLFSGQKHDQLLFNLMENAFKAVNDVEILKQQDYSILWMNMFWSTKHLALF